MVNEINIKLVNDGTVNKNTVYITTELGTMRIVFSYQTPVAVDEVVSKNDWSKTTGKLLNELCPDKTMRVEHNEVLDEIQKRIRKIIYTEEELEAIENAKLIKAI